VLIAVLGVVNVGIAFAAMFSGVSRGATGTAAVLPNAQPLLILFPAWWLYGERPTRHVTGAIALGFAGLALVAAPNGSGTGASLSLVAAGAATGGTLLVRQLDGVDLVSASGWQFSIGGAVLAGWAGWTEGRPETTWTPRLVGVLAFLAIIATAAAFLIWFTEARRARLDQLTSWTLLVPVLGLALAMGSSANGRKAGRHSASRQSWLPCGSPSDLGAPAQSSQESPARPEKTRRAPAPAPTPRTG
jgi:drug/metabolite transporter (DMT)-like permease